MIFFTKTLDKSCAKCYNMQVVRKRTATTNRFEKNFEKVEKTFKKGIDKQGRMWYNSRAAAKAVANDP